MPTRISVGVDDCLCLSTVYYYDPTDCKIAKKNSLYLFGNFCNNYNIGELTSTTSKKEWPQTLFLWVPHPLIYQVHKPESFIFAYAHPIIQCYRHRRV